MTSTNILSVGTKFHMLACNAKSLKCLVAVMCPIGQSKEDAKIGVTVGFDAEGFGSATNRVFNHFFSMGSFVSDGCIGVALAE